MSVPMISMLQSPSPASSSVIATLYGSCAEEHAADQMRRALVEDRAFTSSGISSLRSASKTAGSR